MSAIYMTREKIKELEEELRFLQTKGRKEVAQKIADARSHGDLSENAEYDAAKEEQGQLEAKISKIAHTLGNAQAMDPNELPNDKVYILSKVKLKNLKNGQELDYILVSPQEADFEKKKISVDSPIGKSLMGKKIGDKIELKAPVGKMEYELLDINR